MNTDIRWKQRFQNFEKAFKKLNEALELEELSDLEENGLIQRFEFTTELCWNILKDYMEEEGIQLKSRSPKDIIREAGRINLIDDTQNLIDALTLRNELSHDYDGDLSSKAIEELREKYFFSIKKVYEYFRQKMQDDQ